MKKERVHSTENERIAQEARGIDTRIVNMDEKNAEDTLAKERASKFNDEVGKYNELMEGNNSDFRKSVDSVGYDITRAEIKPMLTRLLVKPFKVNPFQKMEIKNGIILDAGGYTPHTQLNPQTGKYEEQEQFILTGCVIETGPETKYLREGDVIYYRRDTVVPVPFFRQGLVSLAENQVIAVVNEGLQDRFDKIRGNGAE